MNNDGGGSGGCGRGLELNATNEQKSMKKRDQNGATKQEK